MSSLKSIAARVLAATGMVVAVVVTFVVALFAGVLIHLRLPVPRRCVVATTNQILASTLAGRIEIEQLDRIGLDGLGGVRATVRDPDGVQVLHVDDVNVRVAGLAAARSALFGSGPIGIDVSAVEIGNVDANLDGDESGALRLAKAFAPKTSKAPEPAGPPGRGVRVAAALVLKHAWVHGTPPGALLVDVDIHDVALRAHVDPATLRANLDGLRFETRALPRKVDPHGKLVASLVLSLTETKPPDVEAHFDGAVGDMPTLADAKMIGGRVDARVDTQDTTGTKARAVVPEVQVHEALSIHAEAHGPLSGIDAKAAIALGAATVDADARIGIGETTKIDAKVRARHVDAHAVVETAPKTDLGLDARGNVALSGSAIDGEVAIDTLPGKVDDKPVPPIEIRAKQSAGKADVHAKIDEPSAPTLVTLKLAPRADGHEGQIAHATVRSTIPELRRLPLVGPAAGATGSVEIEASGHVTLPEKTFDAKATVKARGLVKNALRLGAADIVATASGSVDHPIINGEVHARDLLAGDFDVSRANAKAHVEVAGSTIVVDDAWLDLVRRDRAIAAHARRVRVEGSSLRVEEAEITGLGEPIHADVVKNGAEIRAKIVAPRIDVATVGVLTAKPDLLAGGMVTVDADVTLRGAQAKATVQVDLVDVAAFDVRDANAKIKASIDGRDVGLDVRASVADAGEVVLHARDVTIGGPAMDPTSWARAHGKVDLDLEADLRKIAALLPKGELPLSELGGTLKLVGQVGRDSESAPPEAQIHAHTVGLALAGASAARSGGVETVTTWRSPDVDIALEVRTDATSGQTGVALRATDLHGLVVAVDAKSVLPYGAILANPAVAKQRALEAPLSVKLAIPSRRLDQLPAVLGVRGIEGSASIDMDVTGTAFEPDVRLVANARGLRDPEMPTAIRTDADVGLSYDGKALHLTTKLRGDGRELVDLVANADVRARDLIEGKSDLAWKAGAKVRLASFPLQSIHDLADRRIRGNISGLVTLDNLHEDARLEGRIDLDRLAVGAATYERGTITVEASKDTLKAHARLEQTAGFFDASATAGIVWGARIAPELDESRPAEAKLTAKDFRALVAQAFLQDVVPTLDGFIDADASAKVSGGGAPILQGKVTFRDGTVLPAALGTELRGVRATATMSADGTIRVADVSARGVQGEITADALVKLVKMRLASATANVRVSEAKRFELALDGTPVGSVAGTAKIDVADTGGRLSVVVDVPAFSVELPQTIKSTVQGLDPKENVKVGVFRKSDESTLVPLAREKPRAPSPSSTEPAQKIAVDIRLGRIAVNRPNSAEIILSGNPKLTIDGGAHMSGQIHLDSGWANLQGKKFRIEKGTVTFTEETPPNPVVVATAVWVAPNGSRVYADFVGPAKTGKVTLRSEPPMPKDDILALILFGSADGANSARPQAGSKPDGKMQAAQGLGGGLVAEGLTQALDDLAGIKANARIDTSRSNNPRPEVEFQLTPKVSVAFSHVLGTPPITEPDKNLATVGWRVYRNWSLETTVGDRGRALLDGIWQHRY